MRRSEGMGRTAVRRTALTAALLVASACSDATAPAGRVVAGVDLDVLFAAPTSAETEAVEAEWAARSPGAFDVEVVHDSTVSVDATDLRVRIVSHRVGDVRHFGAVVAAEGLDGPTPTLVYAHGGDQGVGIDEVLLLLPFLGDAPLGFVWVIPSFRAETLDFGARRWTSDGPPSPWDRDVDDALALLDVAFQVEPAADSTRVGVLGFSRGAGVGLLMGVRDTRVDRIIDFSGPTDFFGRFMQDVVEETLRGTPRDLPGLDFLDVTYLRPLARGEISMEQVRTQLVRRSPVLFADRLPAVQIHHGTADAIVDVGQAQALIDAMESLGRTPPDFQAHLYQGGTHNPLTLANSIPRAVAFLEALR